MTEQTKLSAAALQGASDCLQREAKRFQNLAESATVLADAAALMAHVEELEKRKTELVEKCDLELKALEYAEGKRKEAEEAAAKALADVKDKIAEAQLEGDERAQGTISEAAARAENIVVEGRRHAQNAIDDAKTGTARIRAEGAALVTTNAELTAAIAEQREELARLEEQVRVARAAIAGLTQ